VNLLHWFRRVRVLARTEVLHLVRDRATMVQIIVAPLIQLLLLANVATFSIKQTPAYIVDLDRTPTSRAVIERLGASGFFRFIGSSASPARADTTLLRGQATLVVTIPAHFESQLVRNGSAPIDLDLNAEKGAAAGIVQSYAAQIFDAEARDLNAAWHPNPGGLPGAATRMRTIPRIEVRTRGWYNPTLDYRQYMVPGILVALVTMVGTLLTAQNVAREKEAGTLEQLNVTPITKGQFIAAKLLPFLALALFDLVGGLIVGILIFHVPVRGSLPLFFGTALLYLISALAIGLWISTMVDTQQQAMFVTFFILMVYLLMSGIFTPVDSMPGWVRAVANALPIRHFVRIARAVLIKGAGIAEVKNSLLVLAGYAALIPVLAVRQYSKRTG
jgi:ABC-type multidrug transport system permease subunit